MSDISTSEQGSPTSKTLDDKDSDTDPDTNNNRQLCAHNAATPPPDALPREPRIGVEGNWPTFVYLSFPLPIDLYETLPSLLSQTLANLPPGVELKRVNPLEEAYHLSLSKTVYLKLFQIDRFVANLKKRLKGSKKFSIGFANLSTFRNDADSKSFLGLMVGAGGGQLRTILKEVDHTMLDFRFPTFYTKPRFHISVAWTDGPILTDSCLPSIERDTQIEILKARVKVDKILARIGNRLIEIPLEE